jgi:5-deoxy-glucuronate isomerase
MKAQSNLLIPALSPRSSGTIMNAPAAATGFSDLSFKVERVFAGDTYRHDTGSSECCIVMLGGTCDISGNAGTWTNVGKRATVFDGMPHALYLPPGSTVEITVTMDAEIAFAWCPARPLHPARLITPADIDVELRGGGNATRQINPIMPPEFPADRLLITEVFTPSGNWSSYPPHKHDVHNPPDEVDLEETYYYKIDKPEGWAIQRVYTNDHRIDETMVVHDGELVLVPEGYHPVVAAHGYTVYYLNALVGSARSMAASYDPDYDWVRGTWTWKDPRVPVVK